MNRFLSCAISVLCVISGVVQPAQAREPQTPAAAVQSLPTGRDIEELAQLKLLRDLTPRLQRFSPTERRRVYLAIAVERQILPSAEALDLLQTLGSIEGFDRAARQLCGYGSAGQDGALFELRVARAFVEKKMPVIEIRQPFKDDPNKRSTDIDLVVEHPAGHLIGIECKSGAAPTDSVSADAGTLRHFIAKHPGAQAAFSFARKPTALSEKLLGINGITILTGSPKEQAAALWDATSAAEKPKGEP